MDYRFVCLSVCLPMCLFVCLVCLSVRRSVCLAVCLSDSASVCLLVFGAVWVSVRLSVCLSVCLSVFLTVYLSGSFLEHQMLPGLHFGDCSWDVGWSCSRVCLTVWQSFWHSVASIGRAQSLSLSFFGALGGARAQFWSTWGLQGSILRRLGLHSEGFGSILGTLEAL